MRKPGLIGRSGRFVGLTKGMILSGPPANSEMSLA